MQRPTRFGTRWAQGIVAGGPRSGGGAQLPAERAVSLIGGRTTGESIRFSPLCLLRAGLNLIFLCTVLPKGVAFLAAPGHSERPAAYARDDGSVPDRKARIRGACLARSFVIGSASKQGPCPEIGFGRHLESLNHVIRGSERRVVGFFSWFPVIVVTRISSRAFSTPG